jgi:hypothetical protein
MCISTIIIVTSDIQIIHALFYMKDTGANTNYTGHNVCPWKKLCNNILC